MILQSCKETSLQKNSGKFDHAFAKSFAGSLPHELFQRSGNRDKPLQTVQSIAPGASFLL